MIKGDNSTKHISFFFLINLIFFNNNHSLQINQIYAFYFSTKSIINIKFI